MLDDTSGRKKASSAALSIEQLAARQIRNAIVERKVTNPDRAVGLLFIDAGYGRGAGLGRGRGVAVALGVGRGVSVAVAVAVAEGVGVGVGVTPDAQYLPPLLALPESIVPPQTIISLPVHTVV